MAVVEEVNKGADGLIRSVNVRTSTGRTNRPLAKLYPLEVTTEKIQSKGNDISGETLSAPASQSQTKRPVRQAALSGRKRVQQWTKSLLGPPEDVKY